MDSDTARSAGDPRTRGYRRYGNQQSQASRNGCSIRRKDPIATSSLATSADSIESRLRDTRVFHAVPDAELYRCQNIAELNEPSAGWVARIASQTKADCPLFVCSYFELAVVLVNILNLQSWTQSVPPVVCIVDLDRRRPADLIFALATIRTIALRIASPFALLTISTEECHECINQLFKPLSSDGPHRFILPTPPLFPTETIWIEINLSWLPIYVRIGHYFESQRSHLVLCLDDVSMARKLAALTYPLNQGDASSSAGYVRLVSVVGAAWHFRGRVIGFDHLHVVHGGSRRQRCFDQRTNQALHRHVALSYQERIDGISWERRTDANSVTHYVEEVAGNRSASTYTLQGPPHDHIHVINPDLLELASYLARCRMWAGESKGALSSLRNGISKGVRGLLEFALRTDEAMCTTILPLVDHDPHIALFIALGGSPLVMSIKLQLAAILIRGLDRIFDLKAVPSVPKLTPKQVEPECSGLLTCLTGHGSIWVLIGIWHRCVSRLIGHNDGEEWMQGNPRLTTSDSVEMRFLRVCRSRLGLDAASARRTWIRFEQLATAARDHGHKPPMMPGADDMVSEYDAALLERHLLEAFALRLAALRVEGDIMWANDCKCGQRLIPGQLASATLPWRKIAENSALLGIYCGHLDADGEQGQLVFHDWTWIPTQLVNEWMFDKGISSIEEYFHQ
ncbi:hypothetical protein HJFPF1_09488 [Paramyrothecium foliicola]|nr:hypothetical protein HJFPF1_09488 [Paramyrothecium foliicola]